MIEDDATSVPLVPPFPDLVRVYLPPEWRLEHHGLFAHKLLTPNPVEMRVALSLYDLLPEECTAEMVHEIVWSDGDPYDDARGRDLEALLTGIFLRKEKGEDGRIRRIFGRVLSMTEDGALRVLDIDADRNAVDPDGPGLSETETEDLLHAMARFLGNAQFAEGRTPLDGTATCRDRSAWFTHPLLAYRAPWDWIEGDGNGERFCFGFENDKPVDLSLWVDYDIFCFGATLDEDAVEDLFREAVVSSSSMDHVVSRLPNGALAAEAVWEAEEDGEILDMRTIRRMHRSPSQMVVATLNLVRLRRERDHPAYAQLDADLERFAEEMVVATPEELHAPTERFAGGPSPEKTRDEASTMPAAGSAEQAVPLSPRVPESATVILPEGWGLERHGFFRHRLTTPHGIAFSLSLRLFHIPPEDRSASAVLEIVLQPDDPFGDEMPPDLERLLGTVFFRVERTSRRIVGRVLDMTEDGHLRVLDIESDPADGSVPSERMQEVIVGAAEFLGRAAFAPARTLLDGAATTRDLRTWFAHPLLAYRTPAGWEESKPTDGSSDARFCFGFPDDEPIEFSLWIGFEIWDFENAVDPTALEDGFTRKLTDPRATLRHEATRLESGTLAFVADWDGEEAGDALDFRSIRLLHHSPRQYVIANLNLVRLRRDRNHPAYAQLAADFERFANEMIVATPEDMEAPVARFSRDKQPADP